MSGYKIIEEKFIKWGLEPPQHGEQWETVLIKLITLVELLESKIEYAEQFHWD
jgi:hypothetical protein